MPQEGDERLTQKERILLPREKYFGTSIQEMETINFKTNDEEEISNESAKDNEIQTIWEALDKGNKEMKGVALGLSQRKDGYLWHQGKIWIPNNEGIRTHLIRRHHAIPQAGHGGTALNYRAPPKKVLLPTHEGNNQEIVQKLRHLPTDKSRATCTIRADESG